MANIGYVRVSSADQHEARQVESLKKYDIDKWFSEKVSGKNVTDRVQLQAMLDWVREGDTLTVGETELTFFPLQNSFPRRKYIW